MARISYHKVNDTDNRLVITAEDNPGYSAAHHQYQISTPLLDDLPAAPRRRVLVNLQFQDGNPTQTGVNGISDEVLLAVFIHRMECLQAGPLACSEFYNARKMASLALENLHARTRERIHNGEDV